MAVNTHGGNCCGVAHVHDFPSKACFNLRATAAASRKSLLQTTPKQWLKAQVAKAVTEIYSTYYECDDDGEYELGPEECQYAIEVVLAGYQMPMWEPILAEAGFKMVLQFTNSNSDNECYIFLGLTQELTF